MAKVKVTIDKKGRATIEAEGFKGEACTRVTANLVAALGGAKTEELTGDYYEAELETDAEVHRG
jgi:hypothetical protein